MHILFATDLHYLSPALIEDRAQFAAACERADGKPTHYTPELVDALLDTVLRARPDALVLGGDLTLDGERASHRDLAGRFARVRAAGIPVLVVPGNHDIDRPIARRYTARGTEPVASLPAREFRALYEPLFADRVRGRDSGSLSYRCALAEDVWILLLDSCRYDDGPDCQGGRIRSRQLGWIEEQLEAARREQALVIAVMHHNLLPHNPLFSHNFTLHNGPAVTELLERYRVPLCLSGHMHLQHIARPNSPRGVHDVATGSLSVFPNYYGSLRVDPDRGVDYAAVPLDLSGWAAGAGKNDPNLLGYAAYARDLFCASGRRQADEALAKYSLSDGQRARMIALLETLNLRYFSGRPAGISPDDPVFQLWQTHCPDAFFTRYLGTVLAETGDSRSLRLPPGPSSE